MSEKTKTRIFGMTFNRSDWVRKVRNQLEGALGEYAKWRFAQIIAINFDWGPEIKRLLRKTREMLHSPKAGKYDIKKAFSEAFYDAASAQEQILKARNEFIEKNMQRHSGDRIKKFIKQTQTSKFDSESLIVDMLNDFAPDLLDILIEPLPK